MSVAQIIRTCMASVSFTASSTIAAMIIRSDKGLCSPYSRIIFGLSIADIMQSLGIIVSPLAAPSDTLDAPWAMGSTVFCSAIGFILNIGGLFIPFYTLFLTHYFLQRIKYKVTPAQFARKMELRITICIWLFPIIGSLVGWVNGYFNPSIGGSLCMMIGKPLRCDIDPEIYGDCVRGEKASLASLFLAVLPVMLSFVMIIINLARFTFHVYRQEQMFKPTNQEPTNGGSDGNGHVDRTSSAAADAEITIIRDEGRRRGVSGSLAKQSLVQSSLYIASFIICYFAPIITIIMTALRIPPPAWTVWCVSIFWPLGGFFNILIYTRPKVSRVKESNPEYSRVYVFLIVVLSGGEVPTEIDFGDNQNNFIAERDRVLNRVRDIIKSQPFGIAKKNSISSRIEYAGSGNAISSRVEYVGSDNDMNSMFDISALSRSDVKWHPLDLGGDSLAIAEDKWSSGMDLSDIPSRTSLPPRALSLNDTGLSFSPEPLGERRLTYP